MGRRRPLCAGIADGAAQHVYGPDAGDAGAERQIPADLNLQCESEIHVSEVLNQLLSLYPDIQPMLERCACAIGEDIISRQNVLNRDSTLVLLSPVAGG